MLAIQVYYNAAFLTLPLFMANVALMAGAIVYALLRHKSGNVKMDISYEDD